MHGGTLGSGAPSGERNGAYRHGERTKEAMARKAEVAGWIRILRTIGKGVSGE